MPGVDNPADLFTKSVAAPTQRALGPMLSGQVMLNPVSKPMNALEKHETKTGTKMTKKKKRHKTKTHEKNKIPLTHSAHYKTYTLPTTTTT